MPNDPFSSDMLLFFASKPTVITGRTYFDAGQLSILPEAASKLWVAPSM